MQPSDYKTLAAYWDKNDRTITFGLTDEDLGSGWHTTPVDRVPSLDYSLQFNQMRLRIAIDRALSEIFLDSNRPLRLDLDRGYSPLVSLDNALAHAFLNPHVGLGYRAQTPRKFELPHGGELENFTPRLDGQVREAYIHLVGRLMPKPSTP
ncbi:MAG: hypothetical protein AABX32_03400 [Nanoarchaeota archaeon]